MIALTLCVAMAAAMADEAEGKRETTAVHLLSFNIRYGTAKDGSNAWPQRRQLVIDVIRDAAPDFCGLQEALRFQIDAIREALPGYEEIGVGRDDGQKQGEYSAILFRGDRWRLEHQETLWLSDSPRRPGSKDWGNTIPRIVTWGRFAEVGKQDASGVRRLCVFNVHFDHRSQPSRVKSADFLMRLIARESGGLPVVLMGDFNAGEKNEAIERLRRAAAEDERPLRDTYRVRFPDAVQVGTFNGFSGQADGEKIDYVFVDGKALVRSAEILRTQRDGRYPSDHFPVSALVDWPGL